MAKLNCICGVQLSNSVCPNQTEGLILRDVDLEVIDGKSACEIIDAGRCVWECYNCGRLGVSFPGSSDSTIKWYKPEDGIAGNLMAFDKI